MPGRTDALTDQASLRVLVAEDFAGLAHLYARWLEKHGFQAVGPVPSCRKALALLRPGACDAALLDLELKDGPALPVAERLQQFHVPYILASGHDDELDTTGYACDARLNKPFDEQSLIETLHKLLGGRLPQSSASAGAPKGPPPAEPPAP